MKQILKYNRKKKRNKEKKKLEEAAESLAKANRDESRKEIPEDKRTPAQITYDKIQEKRVRICSLRKMLLYIQLFVSM